MRITKLSKLLIAALFVSGIAMANPYGYGPYGPPMNGQGMGQKPMMGPDGMMGPGPFAGIEFNEKQKKTIDELMEKERKIHQQRMAKMQQTREKLNKLYQDEKWDVEAISNTYDMMYSEQRKTIESMVKARNEVFKMLNDEQREQIAKMQQERQKRMEEFQQPFRR